MAQREFFGTTYPPGYWHRTSEGKWVYSIQLPEGVQEEREATASRLMDGVLSTRRRNAAEMAESTHRIAHKRK